MLEAQNSKLKTKNYGMATLAAPFQSADQIADPAIVKVIVAYSVERRADSIKLKTKNSKLKTDCGNAIYFSRSVIPYDRQHAGVGPIKNYLRHLGIYAYRKDFLLKITKLPPSMLEKTESLEQLRVIENGYKILVGIVEKASTGIDTPDQYADFVKRYKKAKD
jgi:3-deoxy-manno-octulosonate cytidylyltransferase (CMP-KDO synthetase)